MPRRKLPSPEDYGKRLAEAKRRAEKRQHEKEQDTRARLDQIMELQKAQRAVLQALSEPVEAIQASVDAMAGALTAEALEEALTGIRDSLVRTEKAIAAIRLPEPVVQTVSLDGLDEIVRSAVAGMTPPAAQTVVERVETHDTLLSGPITVSVTGRDGDGDIAEIRVEPTRH